jgi:hypothetical protein
MKFNSKNKGVGQLIKNIKKVIVKPYDSDNFLSKGIKHRNITIYPIIIYTDKFFGLPGINNYLKEEFEKQLSEEDLSKDFKCIKPLTFIDFNFLIDLIDKAEEIDFYEMINSYHHELEKRNKRFLRYHEEECFFSMNDNFEIFFSEHYSQLFNNRNNYVQLIIKALSLTEGLKGET